MNEPRFSTPVDESYVSAIGRAAFCFMVLEWNAVYCCESLKNGIIHSLTKKTAGGIATEFIKLAENELPASNNKNALVAAAYEFKELVKLRNQLLHAHPCAQPGNPHNSRISHQASVWEPEDINLAADSFSILNGKLSDFNHGFLKPMRK